MRINYYSALISEKLLETLYKNKKPGLQAQVFNRLIVDGLIENNVKITCYSNIPTSKELINKIFMKVENELYFKYYPIINIPILKDLFILLNTYFKTIKDLKKYDSLVCICDVLSVTNALGAVLACKKLNRQCIGIVTDIPKLIESNNLFLYLTDKIINCCTDYIFLTEPMNIVLNKGNKPYKIIEGLCNVVPINNNKTRIKSFVYAGSIDKLNGINILVEAFKSVNTNYELHIYGSGDYEKELIQITKDYKNIKFFGLISHDEIQKIISNASFLVNPRNTTNEMVKYSFPSKNMEYLASGTPFLCTKLPCFPNEYFQYLNLFESDDVNGIKKGIENILTENYDILLEKAKKAQLFMLEHKNNKAQTKKILSLIKEQK
ncbi:MAG: glycosyltransferase [Erysipelotrichaceae bacterium]